MQPEVTGFQLRTLRDCLAVVRLLRIAPRFLHAGGKHQVVESLWSREGFDGGLRAWRTQLTEVKVWVEVVFRTQMRAREP
jgi:hypothetical protein